MVLTSTGATSWPYVASRTCSTVGVKSRICGKHSKIETPPGIWALWSDELVMVAARSLVIAAMNW